VKAGQRDRFRDALGGETGEGCGIYSLAVCEDMILGRRDRFDCGILGLSLERGLNNVDRVIVELDMFGGETRVNEDQLKEVPFDSDVGEELYILYSAAIHEYIQCWFHWIHGLPLAPSQ
jgi:hypothetical protein